MSIKSRINQIMRLLDRAEVILDMVHDDIITKRKEEAERKEVMAKVNAAIKVGAAKREEATQ